MVELISKKEFYAQYASPSLKREVKGSAIGLYICSGITVAFYLSMELLDFSLGSIPWIDLLLMLGCSLGLQFGKSRICAVIITIYGVINTLFWLLSTGRFGGWWIIVIGIAAIKATFALHKEYVRYLRDGELPVKSRPIVLETSSAPNGQQQTPVLVIETTPTYKRGALLATAVPFILLFLSLLLSLFVISDTMLEWLIGREAGALALLLGYQKQYILCIVMLAAAVVMAVVGCAISLRWGIKTTKSIALMIVCSLFTLLIPAAMVIFEDVPALITQAREDVDQICRGHTEEVVVWLTPKARSAYLPGPSGGHHLHAGVGKLL